MTCLDNFIRAGDSAPLLIAAIISALLDLTEVEGAEVCSNELNTEAFRCYIC